VSGKSDSDPEDLLPHIILQPDCAPLFGRVMLRGDPGGVRHVMMREPPSEGRKSEASTHHLSWAWNYLCNLTFSGGPFFRVSGYGMADIHEEGS
jgi:hypothetical protein